MNEFEFDFNDYMKYWIEKYTEVVRENERLRIYNQNLLSANKSKVQGNE